MTASNPGIPIKTYQAGQTIFAEGETADGLYIVRKGKVRIERDGIVLDELGPNSFFGEMAVVDKKPRSATAIAVDETQCVRVTLLEFQRRVQKLDPVMQGILRVLIERLRTQNDKLVSRTPGVQ